MTALSAQPRPTFLRTAGRAISGTVRAPRAVADGGWGTGQAVLVIAVGALNLVGLAMVLSASSVTSIYQGTGTWFHFTRQAMWLGLGTAALLIIRAVDYHVWRRVIPAGVLATMLLLLAVFVPAVGVSANGSTRWIGLAGFTFQPTELFKLTMLVYTADLLSAREKELDNAVRTIVPVLLVFAAGAMLILIQPDLGSVIVAGGITVAVLFVGGVSLGPLAAFGALGGSLAMILSMTEGYRRERLLAFLDPWEDPLNTGYQTIQSQVGIANGGITGVGVGQGRAKWGFLPESHTDFIYAVVAEEMGLIGAVVVLSMFIAIAVVGVRIALRAPDRFGMLAAMGVVVWLTLQAVVNIGAVVGLLPITGVTLPFVSFGGTSLLIGMAAVGLLLNIAKQGRA